MPRRTPLRDFEARRIALIKPSALGDIVHALPVLTGLRRRFAEAQITWVVNRSYEPLLRGHPDLDAILAFDRSAARGNPLAATRYYAHFAGLLRRQDFDLVLDLQGLLRSGLMALATRAPRRVGLSCAREGATWFYTDRVELADPDAMHAVDRCWLLAEALGAAGPKEFRLPIEPSAQQWAARILEPLPRPWIVLCVGARWQTKRWLPRHFATLAQRALDRFGGSLLFVGGQEEREASEQARQAVQAPALDLTGQTSLPQLVALLARADVMLSNDTGPLHVAAALGRPVVAPYTCTSVRENGPYGQLAAGVETRVWCQGSYLQRCNRLECMNELTPNRLWPVLEEKLVRWQSHSRSA